MAIIRKSTNNKCWWGWGEKGTLLQCWWECKLIQPLWTTVKTTVRIGHGITDWFQIRKGVHQGCILSPCLFNLYAEWKWSRSVVSYSLPPCGSLPGSSVHRIFQARILEWVAISFSRGSSQPRDRIQVSHIAADSFLSEPQGKPQQWPLGSLEREGNGSPLQYSHLENLMDGGAC